MTPNDLAREWAEEKATEAARLHSEAEMEKVYGNWDRNDPLNISIFYGHMVKYLAGFAAAREWVSVEDALPEMESNECLPGLSVDVLVLSRYGDITIDYYISSTECWNKLGRVTHWQPLPPPPSSETNKNNTI